MVFSVSIIQKTENNLELNADFILSPEDFNISIPKIIKPKIAETVTVNVNYILQ